MKEDPDGRNIDLKMPRIEVMIFRLTSALGQKAKSLS